MKTAYEKTLKYVIKIYNFYILISNNIGSNFCILHWNKLDHGNKDILFFQFLISDKKLYSRSYLKSEIDII